MPTKKATPKEKYYNSQGEVITREQWEKNDKDLEMSITGYKGYKPTWQMAKEQEAEESAQKARNAKGSAFFNKTAPAADNTRVAMKKPIGIKKKGGSVGTSKKPKMAMGGTALKPVPSDKQKSLGKLPTAVRNKMGYKKSGGPVKKKMGGSCGTPKRLGRGK